MRSRFVKHYVTPYGKHKAFISANPLHYKDANGDWQNIDCSLKPSSITGYIAQNTSNNISSYFPADAGNAVRISTSGMSMKIGIDPLLKVIDSEGKMLKQFTRSEHAQTSRSGNTLTYKELFLNVSSEYIIAPDLIKNNLILNSLPVGLPERNAFLAFSEQIELPPEWSLSCSNEKASGEVIVNGGFFVLNAKKQPVFSIPVPDVFEQNNPSVAACADGNWGSSFKIKELDAGKYEVTVMVPVEWLNNAARNYPVVIDPTVSIPGDYGGWQHNLGSYLDGNPTSFVFVGFNTNGATYNGYISFDISSIPLGAKVTDSRLEMFMNGTGNSAFTETILINRVSGGYGPYGTFSSAAYNDLSDEPYASFECTGTGPYGFIDLGTIADNDIMDKICQGRFQLGFSIANPTTWKRFTSNTSYLEVTYAENEDPVIVTAATYPNGYHIGCLGESNGIITTSTAGGTPYSCFWTGPNGFSSVLDSLAGLSAGTYNFTVTDINGRCIDMGNIVLTEPDLPVILTPVVNVANASCYGTCDGSAVAEVTGGTAGYTYLWSNSATGESISELCPGTYSVIVTDANGCKAYDTVSVTEPEILAAIVNIANASCYGTCDGSAAAEVTGGTAGYTYLWSNSATGESISALCAGSYSVTITDANGCTIHITTDVSQPVALNPVIDQNSNNLTSSMAASYQWLLNGDVLEGEIQQEFTANTPGLYSVIATDENGCSDTSATVNIIIVNTPENLPVSGTLNIFPNPAGSIVKISCTGVISDAVLTIHGMDGNLIKNIPVEENYFELNTESMSAGVYFIRIHNGKSSFSGKLVINR